MPDNSRELVASLRSGRFQYRRFDLATPAAGAGFSQVIDSAGFFQPLAIGIQIVTDATVANRLPRIEYQDGDGNDFARFPSAGATAASLTNLHFWVADYGATNAQTGTAITSPLADWLLFPGWRIALTVVSIAAADQVSRIRIFGRDWMTLTGDQTARAAETEGL